jgi:hypothetical protein
MLLISNQTKNESVDFCRFFNVGRNFAESHDRFDESLPKGINAERNDFD